MENDGIVRCVRVRTWQYETLPQHWQHTNDTDAIPPTGAYPRCVVSGKPGAFVRIIHTETLLSSGDFAASEDWKTIQQEVREAMAKVVWPVGSESFTIYPQSGKKRGEGNGVTPIKLGLITHLLSLGWTQETALNIGGYAFGGMDIARVTDHGTFCVEWETGNISSSHRALNKMALGILKGVMSGGMLVVPSRRLYKFLTDRIGNYAELEPYLDLWKSVPAKNGVLQITVIEHDAESFNVPRIPKGTDGRSAV